VDQSLAHQLVVLIVTRVVPIVQQCSKHSARLPPVVRLVQDARIASKNMNTLVVNSRILRNKLFGDF
jgi:hypothetical protein